MSALAILGGSPVRDTKNKPWPKWPVWNDKEEKALLDVLHSGVWSYNGPKETAFNQAFAEYIGSKYAVCSVNGTVTLQLALEAMGIGWGDEVIVPGLTWQATAACVLDNNAVPIIVDVTPDTWCIDPKAIESAITPRTKAIIPVHLYGSMADMDAIMEIANKHNLYVLEDAAHKQGGEWNGKKAGSIGHIGSFSFQLSKLMTAGEGGALTTSDFELYEKLDALRNCGRRPESDSSASAEEDVYGSEGNFIQSGNYRITDFQAAILLEQVYKLPEQTKTRDEQAMYMNSLLEKLPGVKPMYRDKRETQEAYFNYAFRFFSDEFKGLSVQKFREALGKELGYEVDSCYNPLNNCELYTPHTKPWRYKITEQHWQEIDPKRFDLPVATHAFENESVCFHFSILDGDRSDLDLMAEAIEKIYKNAEELL